MDSREPRLEHASDGPLIDLLRADSALGINELASALAVTATAVRQRLDRLVRAGLVEKMVAGSTSRRGRGRPAHVYGLTTRGRQLGGDNFRDLAMVLWRELRDVRQPEVRRGLFGRIGERLAGIYRDGVAGSTTAERLESVAGLLRDRGIACSVDACSVDACSVDACSVDRSAAGGGGLPVLTSHTCPYPELAEQDRGICAAERLMLERLVGAPVALSECRLDGDDCCRFTVHAVDGVATNDLSASNPTLNSPQKSPWSLP